MTYATGDAADCARAIREVCQDRELAETLARNGRREVLAHHTLDKMVDRIEAGRESGGADGCGERGGFCGEAFAGGAVMKGGLRGVCPCCAIDLWQSLGLLRSAKIKIKIMIMSKSKSKSKSKSGFGGAERDPSRRQDAGEHEMEARARFLFLVCAGSSSLHYLP
jgi:hypothetical protein